jgi:hypothetical protein
VRDRVAAKTNNNKGSSPMKPLLQRLAGRRAFEFGTPIATTLLWLTALTVRAAAPSTSTDWLMGTSPLHSTEVIDNFDDNQITGWFTYGPGQLALFETNQQLTVSGYWPGVPTTTWTSTYGWGWTSNEWSVGQGQTLEFRADLIEMNEHATAEELLIWSFRYDGDYACHLGRDFITIDKWPSDHIAIFSCEKIRIKQTNVILTLALTRSDPNLIVTARVLDKDNQNAVLYERSVLDTPQADPTLTSAEMLALTGMNLPAGADVTGVPYDFGEAVGLAAWQYSDGTKLAAAVTYDNVEQSIYETTDVGIITQPTTQWVPLGSNATFRVTAYGPEPMTYQWQFNGTNITDATNTTLTLTNVQLADEGVYTVLISTTTDSVTSAPANLCVLITPVILQPPLSQTVVEGGSVTLSAVISGYPPPFLFHWRRGMFTPLTNILQEERTCFFTLANVQMNQGGQYRLYITNAASPNWTAVSATFNLTVLADTDADGLPDVWETECGLNPASANHGTADDDGDGLTNGQEYTAGTDPTNALSYLKMDSITPAEGGSAATLGFWAVSNKTYTVQYRDSLDSGDWSRLVDVVAVSSNRVLEISDPGAPTAARRFYRLVTPRTP